jgi:hypothetical protein
MPFCVLTTTVSGPSSGASCGASAVRPCALTPEHDVGRADLGERAGQLRPDLELAVFVDHPQSATLHRVQVGAAREEHHVGILTREPRADVSADRSRPGDDDSHEGCDAKTCATTRRWILPVAVRGMASTMWICFGRL